jgi:hypothetical protein
LIEQLLLGKYKEPVGGGSPAGVFRQCLTLTKVGGGRLIFSSASRREVDLSAGISDSGASCLSLGGIGSICSYDRLLSEKVLPSGSTWETSGGQVRFKDHSQNKWGAPYQICHLPPIRYYDSFY